MKRRTKRSLSVAKRNPLPKGYSRATVSASIAKLRREGKSAAVATAAAFRSARAAFRAKHPGGKWPEYLRSARTNAQTAAASRVKRMAAKARRIAAHGAKRAGRKVAGHIGRKLTLFAAGRASNPSKTGAKQVAWEVMLKGKPLAEFRGAKAREMAKRFGQGLADANGISIWIREKP